MALVWTLEMSVDPSREHDRDEVRLVRAALGGSSDAFSRLVRLNQRRVFGLIGRFFRRPEDVEDVAQDVFLSAWKKLGTYRADAPFEHWLTRICLNRCYERLRRHHPREHALDERIDPAAPTGDPGAAVEIERLLAALEPVDRFILLLLHGEGWTIAEIADRLGWTRVNVKVRAHRARKKLRRLLEHPS